MNSEAILAILASDKADGAKLAAIAAVVTGKTTARELAEVCNAKVRTVERHNTDAKELLRKFACGEVRNSAEVSDEPLRKIAEGVRETAYVDTQICVENSPADSRAHATKELPSEVVISKGSEEICAVVPFPTNPRALGKAPRQRGSQDELGVKFEQWWSIFPVGRKRAKGRCREVFVEIATGRHSRLKADADEMIVAARCYAATQPDPQFVPMPLTWLHQGRWEDDPSESTGRNGAVPKPAQAPVRMRPMTQDEIELYHNAGIF